MGNPLALGLPTSAEAVMVDFFGLLRSGSLSCVGFVGLEVWRGSFILATKHRIQSSFTGKKTTDSGRGEGKLPKKQLYTPTAHATVCEACGGIQRGNGASRRVSKILKEPIPTQSLIFPPTFTGRSSGHPGRGWSWHEGKKSGWLQSCVFSSHPAASSPVL